MKMPLFVCVALATLLFCVSPVLANGGIGVFRARGNDVNVRVANVGNVQNIRVANGRGIGVFNRGNDVNVQVVNGGVPVAANVAVFKPAQVNRVKVATFNGFAAPTGNIQVNAFSTHGLNAFGTRTVVDGSGNVFEQDAFGNVQFRGNAFRGLGTNLSISTAGFLPQPAVVSALGTSFYAAPQVGVLNFSNGFCAQGGCH